MGHVQRMQHNRRRQIWLMTKEKKLENTNSRQYDELSNGKSEVPQDECSYLSKQPSRNR